MSKGLGKIQRQIVDHLQVMGNRPTYYSDLVNIGSQSSVSRAMTKLVKLDLVRVENEITNYGLNDFVPVRLKKFFIK